MTSLFGIALAALLLLPSAASHAVLISFTAGNFFQDNLGNDGSDPGFDKLTLTGRSFVLDIDAGIPETNIISDLVFQVGNTGPASPGNYNFTASYSVTADGITGTVNQPFTLIIATSIDTLTLLPAPPVILDLGPSGELTVGALGTGPLSTGATAEATVSALFTLRAPTSTSVPEPATLALLGVALGIFGLLRLRVKT